MLVHSPEGIDMNEQAVTGKLLEGPGLAIQGEDPTDVYCWRMEQLLGAGYSFVIADVLATYTEVDLHVACDLLERGCSERVAYSILR